MCVFDLELPHPSFWLFLLLSCRVCVCHITSPTAFVYWRVNAGSLTHAVILVPAVHREMKQALARRVSLKSVDSEELEMSIALPWPGVEPVSLDYIQSSTSNHKAAQPEAIFSMSLYSVISFTCKNQLCLKITSAFPRFRRYGQWFGLCITVACTFCLFQ